MVPLQPGRGMSVAPNPAVLHPHHRPTAYEGLSRQPYWEYDVEKLPEGLGYQSTSASHGVIAALAPMRLDALQTLLCSTRPRWIRHEHNKKRPEDS